MESKSTIGERKVFIPSQEERDNYLKLKSALAEILRKEGSQFVAAKSVCVGLLNSGATCYLNSLIQVLFNIKNFQNAIFNYDGSSAVVKELQRLFAALSLSDYSAVGTKGLTSAFGWSSIETFEQHDIQEFFCLLLDGLGEVSGELGQALNNIFQGEMKDTLICPSCSYKRDCPCTFVDIPVNLFDAPEITDNLPGVTLSNLLQNYMKTEVLDTDNLWECGGCSKKVQAKKSIEYLSLPPTLTLHLKRFRYDPVLRRRVKLSHPILFTHTIPASELQPSSKEAYELTSIIAHNGTATGGHYRTYVKVDSNKWVEMNDAEVIELQVEDIESLFWYRNGQVPSNSLTRRDQVYENAYILVYTLVKQPAQSSSMASIPSVFVEEQAKLNTDLKKLRDAYRVHEQMVEINVYYVPAGSSGLGASKRAKTTLNVLGSLSLAEVTEQVYSQLVSSGVVDVANVSLSECRLRRYIPVSDRLGETFGKSINETLFALGFHPAVLLALESKLVNEQFAEFNPKEMSLRLLVWDGKAASLLRTDDSNTQLCGEVKVVVVPGEELASVGALRMEAASVTGASAERLILIRNDSLTVTTLNDDRKLLRRDCNLWPGEDVIVEILPDGSTYSEEPSRALQALRQGKREIKLFYNDPVVERGVDTSVEGSIYTKTLDTSLDASLADVKGIIAVALGLDKNEFHFKYNLSSPQIKNEKKTIEQLGLADRSMLHVELGAVCREGESTLRFDIDLSGDVTSISPATFAGAADVIILGELAVLEKSSVLHLREVLLQNWSRLVGNKNNIPTPATPHHIRIRDGKPGAAAVPLRDDRILNRCLLGLADGRRIVLQVLPHPEQIGPTDIILAVRVASYGTTEGWTEKGLSRAMDMPFARTSTILQLFERLASMVPHLCEEPGLKLLLGANTEPDVETKEPPGEPSVTDPSLEIICRQLGIAKAYSTGPPLNLREIGKLKWNDSQIIKDASIAIEKPPLTLRDGSVMVVRGQADYLRAKAAAKLRKQEEERDGIVARPSSRGANRPSSRGVTSRPKSRAVMSRAKPQEKPLLLNMDGKAPPLPVPSPEQKRPGSGGLPSAPVRMVKHLRDSEEEVLA